jgi:hypothetical protein
MRRGALGNTHDVNVLNGLFVAAVEDGHTTLAVAQLLAHCPVALLMAEKA